MEALGGGGTGQGAGEGRGAGGTAAAAATVPRTREEWNPRREEGGEAVGRDWERLRGTLH